MIMVLVMIRMVSIGYLSIDGKGCRCTTDGDGGGIIVSPGDDLKIVTRMPWFGSDSDDTLNE